MHRTTSKQRQLVRRVLVYCVMVLCVVGLVTVLVFLMLGYRFNKANNSVEQGGLVQFISRPTDAKITIGRAKLANTTPTKITVNPGQYLATMSRSGYRTWSKTVDVQAGRVLWLNYAQLVPETVKTKPVMSLGKTNGVLVSNNGKKLAYFTVGQPQTLKIIAIDGTTPKATSLTLPDGLLPTDSKATPVIQYWSKDADTILASVKTGSKTEWLYVDVNTPKNSVNISSAYDIAIQSARFDPRSNTTIILHTTAGDVRTVDMASGQMSAVLVANVNKIALYGAKHLLYLYTNNEKKQALGYLTLGQKTGRDLPILADNARVVAGDEYFNDAYISIASKRAVQVYRIDSLPSSTSTNTLSASLVFESGISEAPLFLAQRGGGRFAVVQTSHGFNTYDIELSRYTSAKFGAAQTKELRWLDAYHVYYGADNTLNVAEFDGANSYQIGPANGWMASLQQSGKYLYSIVESDAGYSLQRSQMILD